jgi:hypothetical protein
VFVVFVVVVVVVVVDVVTIYNGCSINIFISTDPPHHDHVKITRTLVKYERNELRRVKYGQSRFGIKTSKINPLKAFLL